MADNDDEGFLGKVGDFFKKAAYGQESTAVKQPIQAIDVGPDKEGEGEVQQAVPVDYNPQQMQPGQTVNLAQDYQPVGNVPLGSPQDQGQAQPDMGQAQQVSYMPPMPHFLPPPQIQPIMGSPAGQQYMGAAQAAAEEQGKMADYAQKIGDIQAKQDADKAVALQGYQQDLKKANDYHHKWAGEVDNLLEDVSKQRIDPNHFHENMSVPQKIATAIGMIVAGAGAGITHQENPVVKWLNNQTERDIDAQKQNINSMFFHYKEKLGSSVAAESFMRAAYAQNYANKIQQIAAQYGGPMAQQQANMVASGYKAQAQQNLGNTVGNLMAMDKDAAYRNQANTVAYLNQQNALQAQYGYQGNLMAMAQNPSLPPELQAQAKFRAGIIPKEEFPKVMQEIKNARDTAQNEKNIMAAWDRGQDQYKMFGLRDAPGNVEFMNLMEPVIKENDGRINETVLKNVQGLQSQSLNFPSTAQTHRQTIQQMIQQKKAAPYAAAYGITMPKQMTAPPTTKVKTIGQE